jgi:hypothetical protein
VPGSHNFRCDDCGAEVSGTSDDIIAAYKQHQELHSSPAKKAALAKRNSTIEQVNADYAATTSAAELARTKGLKAAQQDYDDAIADEA